MSMIEPVKIDYNGEVLSCRVHKIILDLIRSKSTKLNFLEVFDEDNTWSGGDIRRVSVHYDIEDNVRMLETNRGSLSHVRSVSLYGCSLVPSFLVFKYIRVLHLETEEFFAGNRDLTCINRLFLLWYLKVALNYECLKLPSKIGQLQQLETIDLTRCRLGNYPSDINSLPCLSHLAFGETGIALPNGIDTLESLSTLESVCVYTSSIDNIKRLGELTNLRKLQLCSMNYLRKEPFTCGDMDVRMNALHYSISRLSTSLMILTFGCGETGHTEHFHGWSSTLFPQGSHIWKLDLSSCNFQRCPKWIGLLNFLYSLSITVREVADGLAIVGRLPVLKFFHLLNFSNEKKESVVISGSRAFRALKHLIFRCEKASLTFEVGALPKLEKLELNFRYHMTDQFLPVGIEHLPTLTLTDISLYVGRHPSALNFEGRDKRIIEHKRKWRALLNRAFELHLPGADIVIHFFEDYQRLRACWPEAKIAKRFR